MDSVKRERQRELARERQRRRRANPEFREREAQAKRQRRLANPEFREWEAQARRRRREAANPEDREREAQAKRQWRQANPEFREKATQAKRRWRQAHRQANPEFREKETKAKRRWRQANPELRQQEAEQRRRRREIPTTDGADGRFEREFLDREFGHSCKQDDHSSAVSADFTSWNWPSMYCSTHGTLPVESAKAVQTETTGCFSGKVDVAVGTTIVDWGVCQSTQTLPAAEKVHRWADTTDLDVHDSGPRVRKISGCKGVSW
ncbi:zinc finger CCCH domain-containing protein 13-like isoform X3 [Dermacentor silvarum]|uniref:zinc finger CCCH domain-containing protein 13-like isoform X3 n=1 Tax=Dermacentor silvarum TaxID=543639 RepID=UPI001898363F|nr:zinc finger CCCH domain-containing protein 13-like isoform X3 [Dermacentor silvarum]